MKISVLRSAVDDLADAQAFYNLQQLGLGDYFLRSVFGDVDDLAHNGGVHAKHFGFHRLLAAKFPHAIYYKLAADEVVVYRVLDCRRDPRANRKALENL
jgi:hypothetical protein